MKLLFPPFPIRRALLLPLCLPLLSACGGGGGSSGGGTASSSTVSVTPASPLSLVAGETSEFSASVSGNASPQVSWSLQESGAGALEPLDNVDVLYTAPATAGTYHLLAQDSHGGSTTITLMISVAPQVSISPTAASVQPGGMASFSASVSNGGSSGVSWAVEEAGGGSVDSSGHYTAPATAGIYHVSACSNADSVNCSEAAISVAAAGSAAMLEVLPHRADVAAGGRQAFVADLFNGNGGVSWSVSESGGGSISSGGVYTAPAAAGAYHVVASNGALTSTVTVTVPASVSTRAPRIWLDSATLATLRSRMTSNTAAWQTLKAECDRLVQGNVHYPDGSVYFNKGSDTSNDIYQGYQGSDYYDAVLALGLAAQTLQNSNPALAAQYAQQGVNVLMALSTSGSAGQPPSTDDGYGIRFYVPAMALGLDWLHDALTASQRQQLIAGMHNWVTFFEQSGFENAMPPGDGNPPNGNYFAGYYNAKALAALSSEGEDSAAPAQWTDWLERVHGRMVQPNYQRFMAGGGAPEGWNYSPFATENMIYPTLAARTAKNLDLVGDASRPFAFPRDMGNYIMQFTWPDRLTLDDRGTLYNGDNPAATQTGLSTIMAYMQDTLGAPSAPYFHKYASDIRSLQGSDGSLAPWQDFLFWDSSAAEADYTTLPLFYSTTGTGEVAMRSSWTTDAVWASFRSAPYIANGGGGHEYFDQGSLAIVRGGTPLLINSTGELERNTPGLGDGGNWDNEIYDNLWNTKVRDIFNVFYVGTSSGDYGQAAYDPTIANTALSHVEDGGGYVRMRGEKLEQMYRPGGAEPAGGGAVRSWTRDVVYLRPKLFVIYDRTTADSASRDQWLAWHFGRIPVEGTALMAGTHRWDISYNGSYVGAMTTVLPLWNTTSLVNVFNSNKVYRIEERAGSASASHSWLTVFEASGSSGAASFAIPLTAGGNITAGAAQGVQLNTSDGNYVVLFGTGAAGGTVSGTISFVIPATASHIVLCDLPANTGYAVTATSVSGGLQVQVSTGSGFSTTAKGTLYLSLTAAGVVSAGS